MSALGSESGSTLSLRRAVAPPGWKLDVHQRKWKGTFHDSSCMKTEREKRNGVPQASCPVGMNVVLSCALGQVWWTDNHSCSNCDSFAYMSWMQGKLSCSCQSMNLLTETFGSSLIQNGLNFFFPSPPIPRNSLLFTSFPICVTRSRRAGRSVVRTEGMSAR